MASDPSPGKTESTVWDAGPGAKLRFQGFPSATPPDSAALPQVDLTELPGSRIVLRRGVQQTSSGLDHQGASLFAVCLQAPSTALPPHADEVAFDRMEVRIREEFTRDGAQMNLFAPGPRVELGKLQVLPFSGEATPLKARSGIKKYLRGKNFVGFVGEPPEILVCSFACVETSTVPHTLCGPVVESASLEGVFVPPPRPSALVRAALRVRERTVPALGLLLGALLIFAGAGVVLWPARRPA
ncbi:MAG: hypothetical protein RMJ98_09820 [Myxococcales bacterium]|nr:hypothetical protein [Myxococcales bacterium]